ncbi:MAG TPA: glycosyltransferase family 2 protein [Bryobacteraceae bacterium]|jgi:GT2 family glycosyltransferase|nr:glycosyltransferase family 2 protein [Bryobacteraceae bacterium]
MSSTTVIVVTHDSGEVIDACLQSCRGLEVLVIDNASGDDTAARVRRHDGVRLIENSVNRGFAGAVNQAVKAASGDYLLLLNPDTRLLDAPAPLGSVLDKDASCAIAAGLLVDKSGETQKGFTVRRFPTAAALAFETLGINRLAPWNPVNRAYRYLDLGRNLAAPIEVDQPAGAFLLFRRQAWSALNGFDERFHPVWFEDVDFCRRAKMAGFRILLVPTVRAWHEGGHSVMRLSRECRERYWYASLLKYAAKHFTGGPRRIVGAAVILGSVLRAVAGAAASRSLKPFRVYSAVIRAAAACMASGHVPDIAC